MHNIKKEKCVLNLKMSETQRHIFQESEWDGNRNRVRTNRMRLRLHMRQPRTYKYSQSYNTNAFLLHGSS